MAQAPDLEFLQDQQLIAAIFALQAGLAEQRLERGVGVAEHGADGLGWQCVRADGAAVAGAADQQVALLDERDAPEIVAGPIGQPSRGNVAAYVDFAGLHRLLQAQAGQHMVLGAGIDLPGDGLHQLQQDAFRRLLVLDAHQRHAPAFGDGEAQHRRLRHAVGSPQRYPK